MLEIYWASLVIGAALAVLSLLGGDSLVDALDGVFDALSFDVDFLHPMPVLSGLTVFGTAGIMLTEYTALPPFLTAASSAGIAIVLSILLHFAYVKPMRKAENSLGYSIQELKGKIGEVNVSIPAVGYGEVEVRVGSFPTHQLAGSFDGTEIRAGTKIVVVEVKEGAVYVAPFDADNDIDLTSQTLPLPDREAPPLRPRLKES